MDKPARCSREQRLPGIIRTAPAIAGEKGDYNHATNKVGTAEHRRSGRNIRCRRLGVVGVGHHAGLLSLLEKSGSGKKYEDRNCSKENASVGKFELVEVSEFLKANGTGGVATLKTKLDGAEVVITCKKATGTGEFGPKGLSKGEVSYEGCTLGNAKEEITSCEVPNIRFKIADQLVENAKGEVEDEIKPESGSVLVEIEIKNKGSKTCVEKGQFPVDGTQNVEVEQPSSGCKLLREVTFKPSGSHLTFDGQVATSEGKVSVDLNNDDSWGVSIP